MKRLYIILFLLFATTVYAVNDGTDEIFPSGNVGIGTTAPLQELDIVGDCQVGGIASPAYYLNPTSGDTWHIYSGAESYLAFSNYTDGIEALTLINSGDAIFYGNVEAPTLNITGSGLIQGNLTIGNYTLPTAAGSDNQILKYNGSVIGWEADAGASGGGDLLADGTVPLTADWNAGNSLYDITAVEFKGALIGNATTATTATTANAGDSATNFFGTDDVVIWDSLDLTLSTATSGKPLITLESDGSGFATSAELVFFHDASNADDDDLGLITFKGDDSANNTAEYAYILAEAEDVSDSAESGSLDFHNLLNAVDSSFLLLDGYNGTPGQGGIIFNEDAQDIDFRIETSAEPNFLYIDSAGEWIRLGDWDTNYIQITSGGDLTLVGGASLTGDLTGQAATVATITGLAPDTQNTYARTQYLIPYASSTTAWGQIAIGDDGQVLTSGGAGVAPAFEAAGGGAFSDAADPVVLNTTTKDVVLGTGAVNTSKLTVDGDADQVQFTVQGNGTQTDAIAIVEKSDGTEILEVNAAGIVTRALNSAASGYANISQVNLINNISTKVLYDTELYDVQSEFNSRVVSGTADATEASKLHDADAGFEASDVGANIYNTTDNTYTTVSAYVDAGELTLAADIMVDTETYKLFHARFTADVAGKYFLYNSISFDSSVVANKAYKAPLYVNGIQKANPVCHASVAYAFTIQNTIVFNLAASDYVEFGVRSQSGDNTVDTVVSAINQTQFAISKLD